MHFRGEGERKMTERDRNSREEWVCHWFKDEKSRE